MILIMLIGEALEHFAIDRTRTGIAALLALRPDTARVRHGDHEEVVPVEEITPQHVVIVRPGDRVPVDGRVLVGSSSVDQSPITGESVPADKTVGDEVFAGTINMHGALELSVERLGEDTTLERIIHLVEEAEATDFVAHPGLGAEAISAGETIRVGSPRFLQQAGIESDAEIDQAVAELSEAGCTVVLVARDSKIIGAVAVEDTIRGEARSAVDRLRESGIQRIVMLTGDNRAAAKSVGDALAIDEVQSELMPADKVEAVRRLQSEPAPVAMVGDGINDAPSLVAADVAVAMADIGTDVAISSADVALMGDDLANCSTPWLAAGG